MKVELDLTDKEAKILNNAITEWLCSRCWSTNSQSVLANKIFEALVKGKSADREERLKLAYKQLDEANSLVKSSRGCLGFIAYCGARQVILDIFAEPTKAHNHLDNKKDCPASFCDFNMHPGIKRLFESGRWSMTTARI